MSFTSDSTSTEGSSKAFTGILLSAWRNSFSDTRRADAKTRTSARILGFTAWLMIAGFACAWSQIQDYRIGVKVELVSLFATVQDQSGKLVTGLNRDDFVIYDNGVPQMISQFSREYIPLSVIILLDTSSSMDSGKKLDNAKKALVQFLRRLRAGDEAMLMTFRTRARVVQPFTQELAKLTHELNRLDANESTALYDAILTALAEVQGARNRRRALLLISDGVNTYGRSQLREAISELRRGGVELFAIGLESGLPEDMKERVITREVLDQLTRSAGGEAFVVSEPKNLARICATISDRMHNQYTFGYYPSRQEDYQWRSIRLEAKIPGLKVTPSKTGYYPAAEARRQ
jgi:Ca-activated chloride channel homolog